MKKKKIFLKNVTKNKMIAKMSRKIFELKNKDRFFKRNRKGKNKRTNET